MDTKPRLKLPVQQVAELLGVDQTTVRRHIKQGLLPRDAAKRIDLVDVFAYVRARGMKPAGRRGKP